MPLLLSTARLLETLSEYDIASPVRVNALGEPFPTNVHFKRRRRSINSASDPWPGFASSSSSATSSQEHYRLSAFGQQFLFNLTAHAGFIAPMFTVTLLGAPGVNQTKFYSEEEAELKHCFYKGHVNTKSEHRAVISLCSGMVSGRAPPPRPCPLTSSPASGRLNYSLAQDPHCAVSALALNMGYKLVCVLRFGWLLRRVC